MNDWRCVCGATSKDDKMMCWHCGEEREFCMSASQARAVARKLNRLDKELAQAREDYWELKGSYDVTGRLSKTNRDLRRELEVTSALLASSTIHVAKLGRENANLRRRLAKTELRAAEMQGRLDGIAYHWQAIKNAAIGNQSSCAMIIGRIEQIAYLACGPQTKPEEATDEVP